MHDAKKSAPGIVPRGPCVSTALGKVANKGAQAPAESLEGRAGIERNPGGRSTGHTQWWGPVTQGAERIRQFVKREPKEKLTALLHHITPDTLRKAYHGLQPGAAAGVDGMSWAEYGQGLEERLLDLHGRVQAGTYRASPSRRVNIPKPDGGTRPLGVAALEDKIVQKAVVDTILTPIYEAEFLGFSYGFRPGRGAHNALDAIAVGIARRKINWILDADVTKFFDRIDRAKLVELLGKRIGDKRLLRLIGKWLRAGVLEDGQWFDTGRGTPQGSVISPVLANVVLHYVLDAWVHRTWRPREARGEMIIVRYADDFVLGFQYRSDAERFLREATARFAAYGLALHPDKTRLIEFGRFAAANRRERGQGRPETFDFLGFTQYCRTTKQGKFGLGRKPIAKRMNRKLKAIKQALHRRQHEDIVRTAQWLGQVLDGWLNYYAVPTSGPHLSRFRYYLQRLWMRSLRRRSQRDRFPWERLRALSERHWPRTRVRHPWPDQRLAVMHSR